MALTAFFIFPACVIDELEESEVGDADYCRAAQRWPHAFADREDVLLYEVNRARGRGGMCGDSVMNPVEALTIAPALHCAARVHAVDLSRKGTLTHEGSDGSTTLSRVDDAQYPGVALHEVLAADYRDPQLVLEAWLASGEHCRAIYSASADELGIGYAQSDSGDATAWVLLTAQPHT